MTARTPHGRAETRPCVKGCILVGALLVFGSPELSGHPSAALTVLPTVIEGRPSPSALDSTPLRVVLSEVEGQGRITNAKTETRSAAQGLEREVRTALARPGVTWIGYRVPMVAGP